MGRLRRRHEPGWEGLAEDMSRDGKALQEACSQDGKASQGACSQDGNISWEVRRWMGTLRRRRTG